jgi:hypothetical protein
MKCQEILRYILRYRKRKLKEYEAFLKKSIYFTNKDLGESKEVYKFIGSTPAYGIQDLIEKRGYYLALELPFHTDTVSMNRMLVDSFTSEKDQTGFWGAENSAYKYFQGNKNKAYQIANLLNEVWPKINKVTFVDGIPSEKMVHVDSYDFGQDEIKNKFFNSINRLSVKESTKKVYRCYFQAILESWRYEGLGEHLLLKVNEVNWALEAKLDVKTLASYFEYLEYRCLKKQSEEAYKDLIAVKLFFYAPITLKKLDQICLKHIDQSNLTIQFEGGSFAVPSTFIELATILFSKDEPLLHMNEKKLNKFIAQTSEANKMQKITPTAIRQALRLICHQERFVVESLPRR